MAVTIVVGMTESGKSRLVERKIIRSHKRVIVFDPNQAFSSISDKWSIDAKMGGQNRTLDNVFDFIADHKDFFRIRLVPRHDIAPGENAEHKKTLDRIITMSAIVGRKVCTAADRLLLVVDEASKVSSHRFQSAHMTWLVAEGRNANVDSLFIAQRPQMLHGDIKDNASTVICFKMTTAGDNPFLVGFFGKDIARKIQNLPQYHYVTADDTGKVFFTDEKGKTYKEGV